jgi:hypothetical protein
MTYFSHTQSCSSLCLFQRTSKPVAIADPSAGPQAHASAPRPSMLLSAGYNSDISGASEEDRRPNTLLCSAYAKP